MKTDAKSINLPPSIAAYFQADTNNAAGVAQSFAENAVVIDEGRQHRGRTAIANWKAASVARYHYTSEPIGIETERTGLVVTARVVGEFPGSPITLKYRFTLENDQIARLEITS